MPLWRGIGLLWALQLRKRNGGICGLATCTLTINVLVFQALNATVSQVSTVLDLYVLFVFTLLLCERIEEHDRIFDNLSFEIQNGSRSIWIVKTFKFLNSGATIASAGTVTSFLQDVNQISDQNYNGIQIIIPLSHNNYVYVLPCSVNHKREQNITIGDNFSTFWIYLVDILTRHELHNSSQINSHIQLKTLKLPSIRQLKPGMTTELSAVSFCQSCLVQRYSIKNLYSILC